MKGGALGAAGFLLVLPILVLAAAMGGVEVSDTSVAAAIDIPPAYHALYQEAAIEMGMPWELLAAVGKIESDHGRNPASWKPNAAGARGPMQFLPSTFRAYRWASGSPKPDIYDPRDAIYAAAALLIANDVRDNPRRALYTYNHSWEYVDQVLLQAAIYKGDTLPGAPPLSGGFDSLEAGELARAVLANPRIQLLPEAAADIRAGRVDPRVLGVLLALAERYTLGHVGPFVSGHSLYVKNTNRVSNHAVGRAVDIGAIDGAPVSPANQAARSAALSLASLPAGQRPTEIGSPWAISLPGYFTDSGHQDHLHLGFDY